MRIGVPGALRRQGAELDDELDSAAAQIARLALHDELTGLPNRVRLHEWLSEAVVKSRAREHRVLLLFFEISYLRDVNDTYGPEVGDKLVAAVGTRLRVAVDSRYQVLRYGGAEFVAICERVDTAAAAEDFGGRVQVAMRSPFEIDHDSITIGCALGGALSHDAYADIGEFLRDAHEALTEARQVGSGTIVIRDEARRDPERPRISDTLVRRAFDENEFRLLYQPVVRTADGALVAVEALLRWESSVLEQSVLPEVFLPMLEKTGLIVDVGAWVLRQACEQAKVWQEAHPRHDAVVVCANLGARQMAQANFQSTVTSALELSSLDPELLCLDITDHALRFNPSATWSAFRRIKAMGVRFALDDFGIGVSSLQYLRDFDLDYLRMDQLFVAGVVDSPVDREIVRHAVSLGSSLGLRTIAEGVEDERQVEVLTELGCDLAQGFHFGTAEEADLIHERIEPGWVPAAAVAGDAASEGEAVTDGAPPG